MNQQNPLPVTIYTPESAIANPGRMLRDMVHDLRMSRELSWRLAVRDISAQYRQAMLGFLWALVLPVANTAVWVFLSASGILAVGATELPYPVFVLIGTMLWAIFMEAVTAPMQGVSAARDMLAKINFPREAIVIAGIYQVLFNAAIKLAILLVVLFIFGIAPDWRIVLVPFGVASLILAGTAIGLFLTPIGLLYTDIGKGLPILMQFLMYLTPVVYPLRGEGRLSTLLLLNPLTPLIETTRAWLTGGTPQWLLYFLATNVLAIVVLLAVWIVYRLAMPIIIERMSS
ncbi:MAG: ABC transporter permease [Rhodocyclales bacterium]|nr:ABC transporter permease [Rhodocyclales bacterium]